MKFTDPIVRFTDDQSEVTAGAYRGECGELVGGEEDYVNEITGDVGLSPRHSTPDVDGKFPTMMEIFSNNRPGEILNRPPLDLTGWTPDDVLEPWAFEGVHSNV